MRNKFSAVDIEVEDSLREIRYTCDVDFSIAEQEDEKVSVDIDKVWVTSAIAIFELNSRELREAQLDIEHCRPTVSKYVELNLDEELAEKCIEYWNEAKWQTLSRP